MSSPSWHGLGGKRTLLGEPVLLVGVELLRGAVHRNRLVAARPRHGQAHRLIKEREPVDLVDGFLRGGGAVEHDKRLALGFEVRLGDDVNDLPEFGKDGAQRFGKRFGLDALLEVLDIDSVMGG